MARIYHPDRAKTHLDEACEKFNIIHNAYSILSDPVKKKQYDNGTRVLFSNITVAARWENYLKPTDASEIEAARNRYCGSNEEKRDIIREFNNGKGSLIHLFNTIPYMRVEDESRIIDMLKDLMEKGTIPKITIKRLRK